MAGVPQTVKLKTLLLAELRRTNELNHLPHRGAFLTTDRVDEIFSTESLVEQLKDHQDGKHLSIHARKALAETIKVHHKRLYAILLLMDESSRIHRIPEDEIDKIKDDYLFAPSKSKLTMGSYTQERLEDLAFFRDITHEFYKKQWVFPPRLSTTETLEFPPEHFIFPFISDRRWIAGGYHGDVHEVAVLSEFLHWPLGNQITQGIQIAYKKIVKREPEQWDLVQREVDMLQARRHSNITPLLGSFRAGHEDATYTHSPTRCLYLFSPLASMDMDTWLEKGAEDMSREDLRRFVYFDAMLGIASGLTYIHREIDGRVGYHRDIKPGNLLLFRKEEKGPVWKICDFGSSNLKPTGDTGTKNTVTSHYWAPIEFFEDRNGEDGQTHGRSHDIFSLGCVFLYLVTIVHCGRGDGGIPKFESLRNKGESNTGVLRNVAERGAFCKSMKAVHKWIETLQTESQSYEDKTILALINEMLQPFDERIYAWEVEIDLFILADPNQSCAEINKRLTKVIQNSRGYDAKMKLGPYERAEQKMKSQADNGGTQLRSKVFLRIIHDAGWRAYSPSSTTGSFKRNSTSQKILSTIPSSNATDILFGRQDLYERISNGFRRSDTVALYGMGGVGKSRIAREYASQFMNPANESLKRHTFDIEATDELAILDSYEVIAQHINESQDYSASVTRSREKPTRENVKAWLEDPGNGEWFIVVHGFDSVQRASQLRAMLPVPEQGRCQMIITTRTRYTVSDLLGEGLHEACVKVDALNRADSLRLFTHHIRRRRTTRNVQGHEDGTDDNINYQTDSLVATLWSPMMIRSAVTYMNREWLNVKQMNEMLRDEGFSAVKTSFGDYLQYLLRPLNIDGASSYTSSPRVRHFLFLLAFFDAQGVSWELLELEYRHEKRDLIEFLRILQDCSIVEMVDQDDDAVYVLNAHVRRAILDWIEHSHDPGLVDNPYDSQCRDYGPEGLLQRYNKALAMTYKAYNSMHDTSTKRTQVKPLKPHTSKHTFMPHFECFLEFTKKYPKNVNFRLSDLAVRAVILFSKVLLDRDRYDDAMRVTAYAQAHFKCDFSEIGAADATKSKQARVLFHLVRQLVKVYLARPQDDCSAEYWSKAEALIETLQSDVHRVEKLEPEWAKFTSLKFEIQLDKIRVFWKSERLEAARSELSRLIDSTGKLTRNGDQLHEPPGNHESPLYGVPGSVADREKRRNSVRELQLRVTRESALLHTAEGILHDQTDPKLAHKSWQKARSELKLAQFAVSKWFPENKALYADLGVELAVVNTKIGSRHLVEDAIRTLEIACKEAKSAYGSCRRAWNLERRLNEARLKSRKHVRRGTESSRELLELYEQRLGPEKVATKKCAKLLARGYELMGKTEERRELGQRYPCLAQRFGDDIGLMMAMILRLQALIMWLLGGRQFE